MSPMLSEIPGVSNRPASTDRTVNAIYCVIIYLFMRNIMLQLFISLFLRNTIFVYLFLYLTYNYRHALVYSQYRLRCSHVSTFLTVIQRIFKDIIISIYTYMT